MAKYLLPQQSLYHAFTQQTLDAVYIYEAESKRILETNQAFLDLLGYTEEETRRLTVNDILAEGVVRVTAYFQEIIVSGRTSLAERRWRRKDGSLIDVHVSATMIEENHQRVVFVVGRDITERKWAEQRYRSLFEEAPVMYVMTENRDGVPFLAECNRAFLETLGYQRQEVIGKPLSQFYTQTYQLKMAEAEDAMAHPGWFAQDERGLITKSGEVIQTLLRTSPETDVRGNVIGTRAMYVNITDIKVAEAERQAGLLLHKLTRIAASGLDLRSTAQMLADQLGELLNADSCYITLWDEANRRAIPLAAYGELREIYPALNVPPGEQSMTESILHTGGTLVAEDVFNTPHMSPSLAARFPARSMLGLPLLADDQKLGAVLIAFNQPHRFTPNEIARAERASGLIALIVTKAKLFDELQDAHTKLAEAYNATLEGWARALELKDEATEGHTRRVTALTLKLARAAGLSAEELEHVRRGALLHDIGKVGVPDAILLKPGPLTEVEWVFMRRHAEYAYEMLAPIPFLAPALDIPYCHHEKWDGSGYPRGLVGKEIPLAARLFTVIDVWDALTSDRPYRPAWTQDQALAYITENSGRYFDPWAVKLFLQLNPKEL